MQLTITGRHSDITDNLRKAVEDKLLAAFEGKSLKIIAASAVLAVDKNRCRADFVVNYKGHDAAAAAEGYDMYKVIDEAIAKIDVQLNKFLDKVQTHQATPLRDVTAPQTTE